MLQTILDFLGPAAAGVVLLALASLVWNIVSGAFNLVYDRFSPHSDEEWAALMKRSRLWSGIVAFFKTFGINPPGALRSARVMTGGPLPDPITAVFARARPASREDLEEIARRAAAAAADEIRKIDPFRKATNVHVDLSHQPAGEPPLMVGASLGERGEQKGEVRIDSIPGSGEKR